MLFPLCYLLNSVLDEKEQERVIAFLEMSSPQLQFLQESLNQHDVSNYMKQRIKLYSQRAIDAVSPLENFDTAPLVKLATSLNS